jgi:hypothetical protein
MRSLMLLPLLLASALPGQAHDHGYGHGRWSRRPRVVVVERDRYCDEDEGPRWVARRSWRACPPPVWVAPAPICRRDCEGPILRFEFNLR